MRGGSAVVAVLMGVLGSTGGAEGQRPLTWPEFRALDRVEPDRREPWGDHPDAFGELYLPPGSGPHPVAVVVHGGCWRTIADVGYVSHLARALADAGWAAWVPEFRRIGQPGAEWPGLLVDLGRAVDHLRVLAASEALDLGRVVALGHSSGGHLALWLAARPRLPAGTSAGVALRGHDPVGVAAVVGLAAITDLEDFDARGGGGCGPAAVRDLLGSPPAEAGERLGLTSPGRLLPLGVPQLLVHGASDATVPVEHARAWGLRAAEAGDPARVLALSGAGHFEPVAPWTAPFAGVWPEVTSFLQGAFDPGTGPPPAVPPPAGRRDRGR